MSEARLDQIVKGAPPPGANAAAAAAAAATAGVTSADPLRADPSRMSVSDPTALLPSSPPQIYLNLLILEASLRSQYLTLRDRRRQNTFVLTVLFLWIAYFSYLLFLRPREDGSGVGGSVYWVVDRAEKMAWMGGIVTMMLFYATGQWERGVRWPRRWVGVANRGLRGMNCKIVVMKGPWWREMVSHLAFLIPYQLFFPSPGSAYHYIEHHRAPHHKRDLSATAIEGAPRHIVRMNGHEYAEEDVAPGGDHIKLLLLPKQFSADFREKWELYRTEYWEKENERRSELRQLVKRRQKELAKEEGGWLWWTGWRGWKHNLKGASEKHHVSHHRSTSHSLSHQGSLREKKRRPSVIREREREASHSRSSSRSSVYSAAPEHDDRLMRQGSVEDKQRRWSTSTSGSVTERRKKKSTSALGPEIGRTTRSMRLTPADASRPSTPSSAAPEGAFALNKRASMLSTASEGTESDERSVRKMPLPA